MNSTISASTHTAIDDGQTLWIVALPHAQVLAELRALDDIENGEEMVSYGDWCQAHDAIAEYGEAKALRERYSLPCVSYLPGNGWR